MISLDFICLQTFAPIFMLKQAKIKMCLLFSKEEITNVRFLWFTVLQCRIAFQYTVYSKAVTRRAPTTTTY